MTASRYALLAGVGLGWTSACGSVSDTSKPDASAAVDASSIDGPGSRRCDPTASFGAPVALSSLNTDANDEKAALSPDALTIYFSSTRMGGVGGFDIYQATRPSTSAPFGNVTPVTGVNTTGDEREPHVTGDGLSMFASSKAAGATSLHITLATRTSTTLAFGGLQVVAVINGTANDTDPYSSANGNVLYFASDRGGDYGIYRSSRAGGAFSTPTLVSGVTLDSANQDSNPVVTPDELTLYFGSNRPGGAGNYDIYQATRPTVADGFGAPIALASLNTASLDAPSWVSEDGCELYFTRLDATLGYQLYVALRGP